MTRFDVVAFDLYGTLLDVRALAGALEKHLGPTAAEILTRWRKAQLERTWELNRDAKYASWDRVTAEALEHVAPSVPLAARAGACDEWITVPPYPETGGALASLRAAGIKTAVLSNGTAPMIHAALLHADLHVDVVLSVDIVRVYKPDPRVYALLDDLGPRERTLFVSANGWDAEGAKRDGRTVAFLERGNPPPGVEPDFKARNLRELCDQIAPPDWRAHGVRIVKGSELDTNTPQTPGMNRAAAITYARAGAEKLWAGTVKIHANAKTGAHHHGPVESVIYVVSGKARMRWGDRLEFTAEAGPGDFIYVPPYVPHQEINASRDEPLDCVLVRSGQEPVVVNLDIAPAEAPEEVRWVDGLHR
ncbi:MAG: haloacid dehalogenase type II [Myxococcales bacterium]